MDNKVLTSVLSGGALLLGGIGIVVALMLMFGNEDILDFALYYTYALLIAAAVVAVLYGLFYFVTSIKSNIPMLAGIVVFVILAIIAYSVATSEVLPHYPDGTTAMEVKLSDAGLIVLYVLTVVTVVIAILGEILRIFK